MIEIRSYRRVFHLERRIYSIDRFRLNPAGIPVRGVIYFITAVVLVLVLGALPLLALALRVVPWYLRDLILPGAAATFFAVIRIDGRTFHLAARGLLGMLAGPRSISSLATRSAVGTRWLAPELIMLPDGSDPYLRRFAYRGPGAVLIHVGHRREGVLERGRAGMAGRRATLRISGTARGTRPARGKVIVLDRGGRLRVSRAAEAAQR